MNTRYFNIFGFNINKSIYAVHVHGIYSVCQCVYTELHPMTARWQIDHWSSDRVQKKHNI